MSKAEGRLQIGWEVQDRGDHPWLVLQWLESGVPPIEAAPRREGFGQELISRRVPYELKGHGVFELRPGGMYSRVEFPLLPGVSILQTSGTV